MASIRELHKQLIRKERSAVDIAQEALEQIRGDRSVNQLLSVVLSG